MGRSNLEGDGAGGWRFFLAMALAAVLGFSMGPQAWAEPEALTFSRFSERVLDYYPALKSAHGHVEIALARKMQASAGFWPSVSLLAGYQNSDDPVGVFGMLLRQEKFTSGDFAVDRLNTPRHRQDLSAGVHVDWPLLDSFQTIYRTQAAQSEVKAAGSTVSFTQMEALLVARDAYLNALTLEKLAAIVNGVVASADEDLKKAKDLKDRGMILGADYFLARTAWGDLVRIKNELARQQTAMRALLNIMMGEAPQKEWTLAGQIDPPEISSINTSLIREAAWANRPDLSALDARLKALQFKLSSARATALPGLRAFGEATNNRDILSRDGGNNFTVGVKAEMPLFDPSRSGRVKEAKAEMVSLEHDIQAHKDRISRDIENEAARAQAVRDNIGVIKGMADDAKEAVALMGPLYNEGRKSVADVMDARRIYLAAAQSYEQALSAAWLSEARLLFLSGQLNEGSARGISEGSGQ